MTCPCCGETTRFQRYGGRLGARCPICGSLERHRQLAILMSREGLPRPGSRVLHFAPEPCIGALLRRMAGEYVSADARPGRAERVIDITRIGMPSESVDLVVACHVLEHVVEDRRAMAEVFRVLRRGGCALLDVPITAEVTIEDPSVTDPSERLRRYGQVDHARRYGPDYVDRLRAAGFVVDVLKSEDAQAGIPSGSVAHVARRPA